MGGLGGRRGSLPGSPVRSDDPNRHDQGKRGCEWPGDQIWTAGASGPIPDSPAVLNDQSLWLLHRHPSLPSFDGVLRTRG